MRHAFAAQFEGVWSSALEARLPHEDGARLFTALAEHFLPLARLAIHGRTPTINISQIVRWILFGKYARQKMPFTS